MSMETISDARERLIRNGFDKELIASGGSLRCTQHPPFQPSECIVKEVIRYEGSSNPADQGILFAIECPKFGIKGTFSAAYGTGASIMEGQMIEALAAQAQSQ